MLNKYFTILVIYKLYTSIITILVIASYSCAVPPFAVRN